MSCQHAGKTFPTARPKRLAKKGKSKTTELSSRSRDGSKKKGEVDFNLCPVDTSGTLVPVAKRVKHVHFSDDCVDHPVSSETSAEGVSDTQISDETAGYYTIYNCYNNYRVGYIINVGLLTVHRIIMAN